MHGAIRGIPGFTGAKNFLTCFLSFLVRFWVKSKMNKEKRALFFSENNFKYLFVIIKRRCIFALARSNRSEDKLLKSLK